MDDIKFKNIRFDPEQSPFDKLAGKMAYAFGYKAELGTDRGLAQLLRLRVAQKNECAYCIILHAQRAREIGIHHAKVDNISSWWNSLLFTEKEKVTLAYCDALTVGTHKNFQQYHDAMREYFDESEIAEIAAIVINMNVWTRWKLAQGQMPHLK
ncbi:carboxymuconolactone decarboxylase family protein [Flavobacterium macacae]|mgnify:CR=1 FL=1|uniref:Carboxymuconolactone decarboxylase family protein n=1 Tax=Flavobacterium macacae TaxID=2488993 RepID=A0A3P3W750_9FLAO|nr:carboxymuconolactone decarboxylase family protein [Flavobacterium macacae]RRJ90790.1 carboxymuconolactone decarboxylase family protein [Flavobacterium macacae]